MDKWCTVYYRMLLTMEKKYMNTKNTTAQNLQKAIKNHLITVINAQAISKDTQETKPVTPEQFMTDLDFYMESGIFADTLGFKFGITDNDTLQIEVGYMSCYCDHCIKIIAKLCDSVTIDETIEQMKKAWEED